MKPKYLLDDQDKSGITDLPFSMSAPECPKHTVFVLRVRIRLIRPSSEPVVAIGLGGVSSGMKHNTSFKDGSLNSMVTKDLVSSPPAAGRTPVGSASCSAVEPCWPQTRHNGT